MTSNGGIMSDEEILMVTTPASEATEPMLDGTLDTSGAEEIETLPTEEPTVRKESIFFA